MADRTSFGSLPSSMRVPGGDAGSPALALNTMQQNGFALRPELLHGARGVIEDE